MARMAASTQSRDEFTNDLLQAAGLGAAVGALFGLVAGLIPLWIPGLRGVIEEGAIPSALVGGVIGALVGALIRWLRGEDSPRHEENVLTAAPDTRERARGVDEEQVVPVVKEELAIGKREVTKGGLRVHTRVSSVPAEQSVQLREEHATVERVPVDRPAAAGEDLFREQTFEILEVAEEAVVQKRIRVKEEVRIAKQMAERTETVRETLRKTDVEIEHTAGRPERRVSKAPYGGPERRLAAVR